MAILVRSLQRSLNRFELAMAAIVIFIIAGLFLRQILIMSARAEQRFLEASVININTALHFHASLLYLNGQTQKLIEMDGMNPFLLMQSATDISIVANDGKHVNIYSGLQFTVAPSGYQGEVDDLTATHIEAGRWYFDRVRRTLIYRVRNDEYFNTDNSADGIIRFRVTVDYQDRNSNRRYDPDNDIYLGVKMENLGGYQWQI